MSNAIEPATSSPPGDLADATSTVQWLSATLIDIINQPLSVVKQVHQVLDASSSVRPSVINQLLQQGCLQQLLQQLEDAAEQLNSLPSWELKDTSHFELVCQLLQPLCSSEGALKLLSQPEQLDLLLEIMPLAPQVVNRLLLRLVQTADGLEVLTELEYLQMLLPVGPASDVVTREVGHVLAYLVRHKAATLLHNGFLDMLVDWYCDHGKGHLCTLILSALVRHMDVAVAVAQNQALLKALVAHGMDGAGDVLCYIAKCEEGRDALLSPCVLAELVDNAQGCASVLAALAATNAGCEAMMEGGHVAAIVEMAATTGKPPHWDSALDILKGVATTAEGAAELMQHLEYDIEDMLDVSLKSKDIRVLSLMRQVAQHEHAAELLCNACMKQLVYHLFDEVLAESQQCNPLSDVTVAVLEVLNSLLQHPHAVERFIHCKKNQGLYRSAYEPRVTEVLVHKLCYTYMIRKDFSEYAAAKHCWVSRIVRALIQHEAGAVEVASGGSLHYLLHIVSLSFHSSHIWDIGCEALDILVAVAGHEEARCAMADTVKQQLEPDIVMWKESGQNPVWAVEWRKLLSAVNGPEQIRAVVQQQHEQQQPQHQQSEQRHGQQEQQQKQQQQHIQLVSASNAEPAANQMEQPPCQQQETAYLITAPLPPPTAAATVAAAAGPSGQGPAALALVKREVGAMPSQLQLQYWRLADQPFNAADLQQLVQHYLMPKQGVREKDLQGGGRHEAGVASGSSVVEQHYAVLAPSMTQLCQQVMQSTPAAPAAAAAATGSKKRGKAAVADSAAIPGEVAAVVSAAAGLSNDPAAAMMLRVLRCLQLWEPKQPIQPHIPQMLQRMLAPTSSATAATGTAAAAAVVDVEEVPDPTAVYDDNSNRHGVLADSEEMQHVLASQLELFLVRNMRASTGDADEGGAAKRVRLEPLSDGC